MTHADPTYTQQWFDLFLDRIPGANSDAEVEFLTRHLPRAAFPYILDVCCGPGRHAARLGARGYHVVGIDRDPVAIERARSLDSAGSYHCCDVRSMPAFDHPFDAVICMWASFGWFSDSENDRLLRELVRVLRPAGRLILDVYNADFFRKAEPMYERVINGMRVVETKRVERDRLFVALEYEDGGRDAFQWQIFTADELVRVLADIGCEPVLTCARFTPGQRPSADTPRMQVIVQTGASGTG